MFFVTKVLLTYLGSNVGISCSLGAIGLEVQVGSTTSGQDLRIPGSLDLVQYMQDLGSLSAAGKGGFTLPWEGGNGLVYYLSLCRANAGAVAA